MEPTILIATWNEGLFAVTGEGRAQEIVTLPIRGLAPDGHGSALAIVDGHSLCMRVPGGQWTTIATSELELSCCMAVQGTIYVGTDNARMLRLNPETQALDPLPGFDTVAGRDTWFAGSAIVNGQRMGPPLGIRSLAASSNKTVLFANVHVGGIPRSIDGGRTWQPTIEINTDVHEVRAHPTNPEIVAAASAVGLCLSRNSGRTWTIEREGLHAPHCSAVAFSGDEIFLSASVDPFVPRGRVYRRPIDPDGPLLPVEGAMPPWTQGKVDTNCLATKDSWIAAADWAGNLYLSKDFGKTWSPSIPGPPAPSGVLIL